MRDSFIDPQLGEFIFDEKEEKFIKTVQFKRGKIQVEAADMGCIEVFRRSHADFDKFFEEASRFAASQLIGLANDWGIDSWCEENPEADEDDYIELTKDEFAERIRPMYFILEKDGGYYLEYDDDDIFLGHRIHFTGSLEGGFKEASI